MAEGSRDLVERWAKALGTMEPERMEPLVHDDLVDFYPQSGERVVGMANLRALRMNYPGAAEGPLHGELQAMVGADDAWVMGPSYNITHITGSGDSFAIAGTVTYPDSSVWHIIQFVQVRDGKIWRLTSYFAQPFDPPEWRSQWVELSADA
jgi:hypothetical protein